LESIEGSRTLENSGTGLLLSDEPAWLDGVGKSARSDRELLDAQAIALEEEARCPEFSKVGTLSIDPCSATPVPGADLPGEPLPGNAPDLHHGDGYGTHTSCRDGLSRSEHRPADGEVRHLPQSPLTEFDMHFFGS